MISLQDLRRLFEGDMRVGEPLAKYTTFRLGGPADYYVEPQTRRDLARVVDFFRRQGIPMLIIVRMNHMLVNELGYRGAVVNVDRCLGGIAMKGDEVHAGAAARLGALSEFCLERGLAGPEIVAGLRSTVAGGILRHAGTAGKVINDFVIGLEVLREGMEVEMERKQMEARLRRTGVDRDLILSARFRFQPGVKDELLRLRRELLLQRNAAQPVNVPGGGPVFKDRDGVVASEILARAGVVSRKHGGAVVAEHHANCIVNAGGARSSDVLALVRTMQRAARERLHVRLELGIRLVGFDLQALREVA